MSLTTKSKVVVFSSVVVLAIAIGCLVSAWWRVWTYQPVQSVISRDEPVISEEKSSKLVVEVVGGVYEPGVYSFNDGDMVYHAIDRAGGFDPELVDTTMVTQQIELAKPLTNGQKIVVPLQNSESQNNIPSSLITNKVSVNTASKTELKSLEGIGDVRADAIQSNRPYASIDELVAKEVLSDTQFEKIKNKLVL